MFRAALFGAGVTLALIIIPVVHFVTAIPSPFIGGYIAGVRAEVTSDRALLLGALMAGLLIVPLAGVLFAVSVTLVHFSFVAFAGILGAAYLFVASLASLGAVLGGAHARNQAAH